MKGLFLKNKEDSLEKVAKKSLTLSLLARTDDMEIMLQHIKQDRFMLVSPSDKKDSMEFFYILNGKLSCELNGKKHILEDGDYFYVHELEENVSFKTEEEVTILYITSQPFFDILSNQINELKRISHIVEEKDMYTYGHSERLQDYCIKIASHLNISTKRLKGLIYGALYHDIGKINIPDEILQKPGSLTKEEFEYIKKHPTDGKNLICATYLSYAGDIIEQHHERLDGTGYPKGLKEAEISTEAKIIAVVDSYDAMTSDRPYRKGMSPKAAMQELRKYEDTHYDKEIIDLLEKILQEEGKLNE